MAACPTESSTGLVEFGPTLNASFRFRFHGPTQSFSDLSFNRSSRREFKRAATAIRKARRWLHCREQALKREERQKRLPHLAKSRGASARRKPPMAEHDTRRA